MGIQISGVNGVDKIVATDGTIDVFSGTSISGVLTATSFTGNLTGDVTGNLTGNVNHTSNLLLQIGGSEKFRVGSSGQLGIGGANYGTSGQVLQSAGSGAPPTWNTISGTTINSNADNRVITGSGTANTLNGESGLTYNGQKFQVDTVTSESNAFRLYNTTTSATTYQINGEGNSFIGHTYPRSDGNLDLGYHSGYRWRDVVLSGGIRFGSNSSDDYLDDYEEGSFTPTTSGISATHNPNGLYTKIGDMVFISIVFTRSGSANFTFAGGDSGVVITNLPFACGNKAGVGQLIFPRLAYTGSSDGQGATVLVEPGQAKIYVSNAGFSSPRANLSVFYSIN